MRLRLARHQAAVEHVLTRTLLEKHTVAAYHEYAIEGRSAAEVASRHGMTVNNLRQLKHRLYRMISAAAAVHHLRQGGARRRRGMALADKRARPFLYGRGGDAVAI